MSHAGSFLQFLSDGFIYVIITQLYSHQLCEVPDLSQIVKFQLTHCYNSTGGPFFFKKNCIYLWVETTVFLKHYSSWTKGPPLRKADSPPVMLRRCEEWLPLDEIIVPVKVPMAVIKDNGQNQVKERIYLGHTSTRYVCN